MIVYRTRQDVASHLDATRDLGKRIGFVPTMGALHQGHASLIERARKENDILVVSIFVNPTQFNEPADLENYPRRMDEDLKMLRDLETDVVFAPSEKEMYPEEDRRTFDLGGLDNVMEGTFRKGHFNGVAQIVSKLFETVRPHRAYFGQKDFQQLVIIRKLVELMNLDISIVGCPIIREPDGLAMSSRNELLTRAERKAAPHIYQTLKAAKEQKAMRSPAEVRSWVSGQFEDRSLMELEYFEIVNDTDLRPVRSWTEPGRKVACIAVRLGKVRLIDNIFFD